MCARAVLDIRYSSVRIYIKKPTILVENIRSLELKCKETAIEVILLSWTLKLLNLKSILTKKLWTLFEKKHPFPHVTISEGSLWAQYLLILVLWYNCWVTKGLFSGKNR